MKKKNDKINKICNIKQIKKELDKKTEKEEIMTES